MRAAIASAFLVSCAQTGAILSLESSGDAGSDDGSAGALDAGGGSADVSSADAPLDSSQANAGDTGSSGSDSGPPVAIVLVDPASPAHAQDSRLEARIAMLGFTVSERVQTTMVSPADHAALVVVSSSSESANLDPTLADQPIPLVVLESFAFGKLGMTGPLQNNDFGVVDGMAVDIVDTALAGGLPAGDVNVYTQSVGVNYARPSSAAIVVARLGSDAGTGTANAATFCYPAGAMMVSRAAPARRAGVFVRTGLSGFATPEGWVLFDAIVRWAVM